MKRNTLQKQFRKFACAIFVLAVVYTITSCTSMSVNDNIQPVAVNSATLPDGEVADIMLFPNWKQAGAYLKEIKPKDMSPCYVQKGIGMKCTSFSPDVSVENDGYLRKTWVGTDGAVADLYNKMSEGSYRFAIGGIQKKDEWHQIMITCKNGNLTYDRQRYAKEDSEIYKTVKAKNEENLNNSKSVKAMEGVFNLMPF